MVDSNHRWNRELDFEETYRELTGTLAVTEEAEDSIKISILLIALRNGSRIGEAVPAYNEFVASGKRSVRVQVEKRGFKYNRDPTTGKRAAGHGVLTKPFYRLMIIPEEIPEGLGEYMQTVKNLSMFSMKKFNWNPHSLRYAFITYMNVKKKVSPATIAKITGHATLDMIMEYTTGKEAEKILEEEVV